jgi:homoserine kinase type II
MAVYTHVTDQELEAFLKLYDVGTARTFKGIAEGVENSNYYLETTKDRFILTLFEKRVNAKDLPFFMSLMQHLVKAGLPTAGPVEDTSGKLLQTLNGRPAALIRFVDGVSRETPDVQHCVALGGMLARLHDATQSFREQRPNSLSAEGWADLANKCAENADRCSPGLGQLINEELSDLRTQWPKAEALPSGVGHADLFPDNVLFTGDEITGIIDFYFACTDFYAYDLAICLNAWAFHPDDTMDAAKAKALINAYEEIRPLEAEEKAKLPLLLRGAAIRFLLTRLYDWIHLDPSALVNIKDPLEYQRKLLFHRQNSILDILND